MAGRIVAVLIGLQASAAAAGSLTAPLFVYETKQLTDDIVASFAPAQQKLFGFDDSAVDSSQIRSSGECKTFPGDDDWPLGNTWNTFNEVVGGALIPTVPIAAPCYKSWGVYNAEKCTVIANNFTDPYLQ